MGHTLPGTEDPYSSSPAWLADWLHGPLASYALGCSELGARPFGDTRRWTIDQYMPPDQRGYRMGGFFNVYVIAHLGMLAWRVALETVRGRSEPLRPVSPR